MVDPSSAEHWRLPLRLGVVVHFEQVDLGVGADLHERQRAPATHVLASVDLGLEHVPVEVDEAFGVAGEDGDVVHTVQEHRSFFQSFARAAEPLLERRSSRATGMSDTATTTSTMGIR